MITVFFSYGLAFLLMGLAILLLPKKRDLFAHADILWLLGIFGILHGLNEWVDLFILRGRPFPLSALEVLGGILMPVSFTFLLIFGLWVISRQYPKLRWVRFLWPVFLLPLLAVHFSGGGWLLAGIGARYFIGFPGALLTAFGMFLSISKYEKKDHTSPPFLQAFFIAITASFFVYGWLSGFVVPQADFFPASIYNTQDFSRIFSVPVQVFRMLCAIVLAFSFSALFLFFRVEQKHLKFKWGIGHRFILVNGSSMLCIVVLGVIFGYGWGMRLIRQIIINDRVEYAQVLGGILSTYIVDQTRHIQGHFAEDKWIDLIEKTNSQYTSWSAEEISSYMEDQDTRWMRDADNSVFLRKTLNHPLSVELNRLAMNHPDIAEICLTDRLGGLVAASNKTSDFYQGDEDWWIKAFQNDQGNAVLGDVIFDESAQVQSLPISIQFKDPQDRVRGICKTVVDAHRFFESLKGFSIGETGYLAIINSEAKVVFHPRAELTGKKLFPGSPMEAFFQRNTGGAKDQTIISPAGQLVVYSNVEATKMLKGGDDWKVVILQDAQEAFSPLNQVIIQAIFISLFLICFVVLLSYGAGKKLVGPLMKLIETLKRRGKGNLDFKVDIKTGDELEELSDAFNLMSVDLKKTMVSRDSLVKEMAAREKAEKEAVEKEKKYQTLFYSSRDAIMILTPPSWEFTSANPATVQLFGAKDETEFTSKGPWEVSSETQPDGELSGSKAKRMIETAMEKGSHFFEWSHLKLNGKVFPAIVQLSKIELDGIEQLQATVRDITEQKEAGEQRDQAFRESEKSRAILTSMLEDNIRESEKFAESQTALIEAQRIAQLGSWQMNLQGELHWSSEVYQIFGLEREKFKGTYQAFLKMVHPDDREFVERSSFRDMENRTAQDIGYRIVRPDGETRYVNEKARYIHDTTGVKLKSVGTIQDITERVKGETKLRESEGKFLQSQKMEGIGRLAGGIAHDFNNLLCAISGHVHFLLEDTPAGTQQHADLIEIRDSSNRAASLTNQLLAFSRKQVVQPTVFQANDVISGIQKMLMRLIGEDIGIETDLSPDLNNMKMDKGQFEQILLNLAVNARDAMPKGGRIVIKSSTTVFPEANIREEYEMPEGTYVQICFRDSGIGMTPETMKMIFEPFFTTKEKGKGTGLGLSTVYGIVKQNNGYISVTSEPDKGTEFSLEFPVCQEKASADETEIQISKRTSLSGRILLVEDEESIQKVVKRVCEKKGLEIMIAKNEETAVNLSEGVENINLIISDVVLPGKTGPEIVAWISQKHPNAPVLFISGYSSEIIGRHGIFASKVNFLPKPFSPNALIQKIDGLL